MQYKGLEILIYFAVLIMEAGAVACFVMLLHWCMGTPGGGVKISKGQIFSFYGKWLQKKHGEYLIAEAEKRTKFIDWTKPLGVCIYCFMVWVSWGALTIIYSTKLFYTITQYPKIEMAIIFILVFPAIVNTWLIKIRNHG